MLKLNAGTSQVAAAVITFILILVGVIVANAAKLGFNSTAITWITIFIPVFDQALTYLLRGFSTGDWSIVASPSPATPPPPHVMPNPSPPIPPAHP